MDGIHRLLLSGTSRFSKGHQTAAMGRLQPLRPTRGFAHLLTLLGVGFPTRISGCVRMRITAGFRTNTQEDRLLNFDETVEMRQMASRNRGSSRVESD